MARFLPALLLVLSACAASMPPGAPPNPQTEAIILGTVLPLVSTDWRCSAVAVTKDMALTAGHCSHQVNSDPTALGTDLAVDEWTSGATDIGAVYIKSNEPLAFAPIFPSLPHTWERVWLAGYGCDSYEGEHLSVRRGTYLGRDSHGYLVVAGEACHGDSGGGMFTEDGLLVGIIVSVNTDEHDTPVTSVMATPVEAALPAFERD